ncbi:MAG: c-type cytochrome [Limisphaerales bacterium]
MKRFSLLLVAILGTAHAMAAVVLPIEVFGRPGHVEAVEVRLPEGSPGVTAMSLRVHGLNSQNKLSLQINDSPEWITLNRGNVTFPFPDGKFYGMSGSQATIRMIVPLPSGLVRPGPNTIRFRFNDRDGTSIGYRVLDFNFMATPESQPLIPAGEFTQEDPSVWKSPIDSPEAIAAGKKLWYSAPLWDNGRPILATCSDCHAHDGRDLKYFNYSNRSIIERSIYHRLTPDEATQIASYIRSLPVPYEEKGRPWNPPYQPGPDIDSKPVRSWAAGAGLEWVLDRDLDTLQYIFPDEASISSYSFTNITKAREIPLYIQFPDWNHWLPTTHPFDQAAALGMPTGPNLPGEAAYKHIRSEVQKRLNTEGRISALRFFVYACSEIWNPSMRKGPQTPQAIHWKTTKIWEIMQEFGFEGDGQEFYGSRGHSRTWYGGEVFRTAQHLTNVQNTESWEFESTTWYQLQLVLNDGNRAAWDTEPIDWGYLVAFAVVRANLPPSYSIMILDRIKAGESCADFPNLSRMGPDKGWTPHWSYPASLIGRGGAASSEIDRINPSLKDKISVALAKAWLERCQQFSPQEFRDKGYTDDRLKSTGWPPFSYLAPNLESIGADPALVQRARDLAIGINPSLGIKPPPPTNLRAN